MSFQVPRYAKTIHEINETKQKLKPNYHKELSLPIISGVVTTAYSVYAKGGQASCVNLLLKAGADVNIADVHGNTAIGHTAYFGEDHLLNRLIKTGANVDTSGDNAITEILNCLITSGADVNFHDSSGITALHSAARNGHIDCVKRLVKSEANVNKKDRNGYTADCCSRKWP